MGRSGVPAAAGAGSAELSAGPTSAAGVAKAVYAGARENARGAPDGVEESDSSSSPDPLTETVSCAASAMRTGCRSRKSRTSSGAPAVPLASAAAYATRSRAAARGSTGWPASW